MPSKSTNDLNQIIGFLGTTHKEEATYPINRSKASIGLLS